MNYINFVWVTWFLIGIFVFFIKDGDVDKWDYLLCWTALMCVFALI